jgi:hypothetical protein
MTMRFDDSKIIIAHQFVSNDRRTTLKVILKGDLLVDMRMR